jgi:hypothetical protein
VSPNEHESVQRVARYARHVTELAVLFRIVWRPHKRGVAPEQSFAGLLAPKTGEERNLDTMTRIVYGPRVIDETTYVVNLHEFGHLLHPLGQVHGRDGSKSMRESRQPSDLRDVRLLLLAERSAWEWAKQHALEWTELMQMNSVYAFDSYRAVGRRYGHKEAPLW